MIFVVDNLDGESRVLCIVVFILETKEAFFEPIGETYKTTRAFLESHLFKNIVINLKYI